MFMRYGKYDASTTKDKEEELADKALLRNDYQANDKELVDKLHQYLLDGLITSEEFRSKITKINNKYDNSFVKSNMTSGNNQENSTTTTTTTQIQPSTTTFITSYTKQDHPPLPITTATTNSSGSASITLTKPPISSGSTTVASGNNSESKVVNSNSHNDVAKEMEKLEDYLKRGVISIEDFNFKVKKLKQQN